MRWFVRGDVDGFFGLALDNLVQLLLIAGLCGGVLGFPPELLAGRVLPGVAVSLVVGNLFYAWQAKRLADRTGRADVCALPYGINTVSLIAYVFLVMLPAKLAAEAVGATRDEAAAAAWRAGLVACLGSGLIEFLGAFVAQPLRRATPRAALLSTLSGIAVGFISMTFVFRTFARPEIGLVTLGVILLTYFGGVRFRGGLPGGLVAVALGTAIAWLTGVAPDPDARPAAPAWVPPVPVLGDLLAGMTWDVLKLSLPVILPMGVFNLLGSLQNIESAEAAGDRYPTAPSLAVNGLGTVAAAAFGSCFPTTIYIGHPGWKGLGARAGYSLLNAAFFTVICLTGVLEAIRWAVPVDAGMAIVLYIGLVITAQAFQATPAAHAPAVALGLLPNLAAWGVMVTTQALQVAGLGPANPLTPDRADEFRRVFGTWIDGAFALAQGAILSSMLLAAMAVAVIDRKFRVGAVWALAAAGLAAVGLIHSYRVAGAEPVMALGFPILAVAPWSDPAAWRWVAGYLSVAALLWLAPRITEPGTGGHDPAGGTD